MSWRPSDWSPLGLDADPTPGDPVVVRDGGQHYQPVAQALASSAATLRALNGGATTGSQSVTALLEGCEEVLDDVTRAYGRYRVAGDALVAYAYSLDRVQAATAQALATARVAAEQADADRRRAASCAASASAAAGSGSKTAESDAASWNARAAQASADAALQDRIVDNQKMVVSQAVADRDTAATQASSQIEEITASDGLNDTWWDDWGAKLVAVIADIAQIVSMIAGILALLVCWIPVFGQALAGVLLMIAAIAAIIVALANVALAATGERTWGEAVLSIVFAALACVGLGGAARAGAAAFKVLMANGARLAAKQGSTGAAKILARALLRPGALSRLAKAGNLSNVKGMLGEEIINITKHASGKQGFMVFKFIKTIKQATCRMGYPDGALKIFGKHLFAESKNVGYDVTTKTLRPKDVDQLLGYADLAKREGFGSMGKLHVVTNAQTELTAALKNKPQFVFHTFEDVLGTKINAWVQAGFGTGLKAGDLSSH